MIDKIFNKLNSFIIFGDRKEKNMYSYIFIIMFSLLVIADYLISYKYYLNYNFNINPGYIPRIIKILPLIVLVCYSYIKFVPKKIDSFEGLYWMLFSLLTAFPVILVYILNGIADTKNVLLFIYSIEILSFIGVLITQKYDFKFPKLRLSNKVFWYGIIAFLVLSYVYIIATLGVPQVLKSFSSRIYDVRLEYRKIGTKYDDYLIMWLGNVINPFLLSYFLKNKKVKFTVLITFLEFLLYTYSSYKSLLAVFFLAPFFAYFLSKGLRKRFVEASTLLMAGLGVLTGLIHRFSIYVVLGQRIFIWPSLISLEYFDFFSMYPKIKLSHSIFSHFFTNVYQMEPAFLMGSLYYNRPEMRLNTTWFADAYMNFGISGMIIFAVLLFGILLFIRSMENKNIYLVSSLLLGGIIALFNAPLLTTILTHGLGIGMLLAYLLPENLCKEV